MPKWDLPTVLSAHALLYIKKSNEFIEMYFTHKLIISQFGNYQVSFRCPLHK